MKLKLSFYLHISILFFYFFASEMMFPLQLLMENNHEKIKASFENQSVCTQGFLYELSDKRWMLTPLGKIKTCCLNKKEILEKSILLENFHPEYPISNKLYKLHGILQKNTPQTDFNYKLTSVTFDPPPSLTSFKSPFYILLSCLFLGSIIFYKFSFFTKLKRFLRQ